MKSKMKKRFVLLSLFLTLSIIMNAQGIYTSMKKYDKFDDVVWEKEIKTLITMTDSTIVIETKGQEADSYYYFEQLAIHDGNPRKLSNLVDDIWGYESSYLVLPMSLFHELKSKYQIQIEQIRDSIMPLKRKNEELEKIGTAFFSDKEELIPAITFRTISTNRYYFEYQTDGVWISFNDGSRIIYSK